MNGKDYRLGRLFKHSKNLLIVPMDHGVTIGPENGLINPVQTTRLVAENGANAIVVHKGLVPTVNVALSTGKAMDCELIIHLSASTVLASDPNDKELVSSIEHAIRMGATAVSVHVNLGAVGEAKMISDLGRLTDECDLWGLPLLAMIYVRDAQGTGEFDPKKIRHAARVAQELGADIIKVNYTGSPDTFFQVTEAVSIPLLIAGGPKMNSEEELLEMIEGALQAGARGAAIGRNIFQSPNPATLTQKIRQLLDTAGENELPVR